MYEIVSVAIVAILALVVVNSIAFLKPDEAAEIYLIGTHLFTQVPAGLRERLDNDQKALYDALPRVWRGPLFYLDIVFGLWPLITITKFPTSPIRLQAHAAGVFSKGTKKCPRVNLHADPILFPRFLSIRDIIPGIGFFSTRGLHQECDIGEKGKHGYYREARLALQLLRQIKPVFLESFRTASNAFVWCQNEVPLGERDINAYKPTLEKFLLWILSTKESMLVAGKILRRPPAAILTPQQPNEELEEFLQRLDALPDLTVFWGTGVLSVDININDLDMASLSPDASDAQKAVNAQFVKQQEAAGTRMQGFAEADVTAKKGDAQAHVITATGEAQLEVAKKMAAGGVDPNVALLGQMVGEKVGNVNLTGFGQSLVETVTNALGTKKGP